MTRLGEAPFIHPTATVTASTLGRYTEIGAGSQVSNSTIGDYSYAVENTQIAYANIGKFANIASHVRIYASRHPMQRASLHHFSYRSSRYFEDADDDRDFFEWRAGMPITIGHDTWLGHGAVVMPGVSIGNGAVIGANAVVTHDVPPYAIAVGVPARVIRMRLAPDIAARFERLAWWDWEHERLRAALDDFRKLPAADFLGRYET